MEETGDLGDRHPISGLSKFFLDENTDGHMFCIRLPTVLALR